MAVDVRIITEIVGADDVKRQLSGLTDETRKTGEQAEKAKGKFSGLVAGVKGLLPALGVGAVVAGFGKIIQATSDAQETTAKFEAVYKSLAGEVEAWARQTAEATNRSTIDMKAYLATLQDTFVPLGFARDQAAEMSQQLTQLGLDLAAFNNEADADVINNLTSAMVGNHEAVRRYGVIITQATLDQELLNMGIEGGTRAATEQEKAQARLNLIMQSTADAQGTAAAEADGFAGQMRGLMAAATDLAVAIGETGLLLAVTKLVGGLTTVIRTMVDGITIVSDWTKELFGLEDQIENVNRLNLNQVKQEMARLGDEIANVRKESLATGSPMSIAEQKKVDELTKRIQVLSERYTELTEQVEENTDANEDNADVIDDATRSQKDHDRQLDRTATSLRELQREEGRLAKETQARAEEAVRLSKVLVSEANGVTTSICREAEKQVACEREGQIIVEEARKQFSREIISSVEGVTTYVCREVQKQAQCTHEGQIIIEEDQKRLAREVIRSAEGVTISVCREVDEQVRCHEDGQIIIEENTRESTAEIRSTWQEQFRNIIVDAESWQQQIIGVASQTIASIISEFQQGVDVKLHFDISASGAGGQAEEARVVEAIIAAFGLAFGGLPGAGAAGVISGIIPEDIKEVIGDIVGGISDFIGDAIGDIGDFFGDLFGGFFQHGANMVAARPTLLAVGEAGPERVRITPLGAHESAAQTIVFNGPTIMDEVGMRRFLRQVDRGIRRRSARYG